MLSDLEELVVDLTDELTGVGDCKYLGLRLVEVDALEGSDDEGGGLSGTGMPLGD